MKERIYNTIKYYEKETETLVQSYDNADMSTLNALLKEHIPKGKVIDIGCGSGRDLQFLKDEGFEIFGVDANKHFIESNQLRFPDIKENFATSILPTLIVPDTFIEFDVALIIAVWMHIPIENQKESIDSIVNLLKKKSKVVVSFSIEERANEVRFFEKLKEDTLINLLKEHGFTCSKNIVIEDGLGGRNIKWVTQIFER